MIKIIVIRNESNKIVFSQASVIDELIIDVFLKIEDLTEDDLKNIKSDSHEFSIDNDGNLYFTMETIMLENYHNLDKLKITVEEYDFNEQGVLVKVD